MKALFVVGYIACGKSTYVESIRQQDDLVIELGSVVRELTHQEERVFDNNLDDAIYEYCKELIGQYIDQITRVIFVAPRSPQLLDKLVTIIDDYDIVFLSSTYSVREARFNKSKRAKDEGLTYDEALRKDDSIGMGRLVDNLFNNHWGPFELKNY